MHEEDVKRLSDDLASRIVKLFQNTLQEWETFPPDALLSVLGSIRSTIIADYMHEDRPRASQLKLEDKLSTEPLTLKEGEYEPTEEDEDDD